jgi:alanyl-tRNA synthetase
VDRIGAQSADTVVGRIAPIQLEMHEGERSLRELGGGAPKAADLVAKAEEVAPRLRLVAVAGPWESIDAVKAVAKELRGMLPSGVIALALDADEPQVFVTVSDDLVARGIAAGDLVRSAMPALDGQGGGRPEMAQGKGSRRDGLPDALAALRTMLAAAAPSG